MIKRPSSEPACPLSQGSRDSDELCFLSEREREFQFLYKGSLDKKVQWISCQKSQGFRFDRRLLVFHPRSLNIQRREEQKIAGCYKSQPCTCTRKLLLASSTLKKKPKSYLAWKVSLSTMWAMPQFGTWNDHQLKYYTDHEQLIHGF